MVTIFPLGEFTEYEKWILYNFATLPSVYISYRDNKNGLNLIDLLQISYDDKLLSFPEALQKLVRFGWIKRYNYGFNVHNIIQEVIIRVEGKNIEKCDVLISYLYSQLDKAWNNEKFLGLEYIPFAQNIFDIFEATPHHGLGILYNNVGVTYEDTIGDYKKSLELSLISLKIREVLNNKPELSSAYNNLATTYRYLGDYEKALEFANKALSMRLELFGELNEYVGNTYQTISIIYRRLGKLDDAVHCCLKAIEIRQKLAENPESDKKLARLYNNISIIYRNLKSYDKSIKYAQESIEIKEKYYPNDFASLAVSYSTIAVVLREVGRLKEALYFAEKDLDIMNNLYDSQKHPDFASTYNNLAMIYFDKSDFVRSLYYSDLEFDILKTHYEDNHPEFDEALQIRNKIIAKLKA